MHRSNPARGAAREHTLPFALIHVLKEGIASGELR